MDSTQTRLDSNKYRNRNNLEISNANLFISNNNNPFLISPYAPPTNVAKETTVVDISIIISTLIGDLSSIINLSTFTLSISTIRPIPSDPNQEITIIASTLRLDVADTVIHGTLEVDGNSKFNNISTGYLFASVADISSLNVSTMSVSGNIYFSTLIGSTITANTMTIHSTLNVSSIDATGHISFVTMSGSTITTNTLIVHSTIDVSTVSTGNIHFEILGGAIGTISSFTFSSIHMLPGVVSSATTGINSSFIITIGGIKYKIPLELA